MITHQSFSLHRNVVRAYKTRVKFYIYLFLMSALSLYNIYGVKVDHGTDEDFVSDDDHEE